MTVTLDLSSVEVSALEAKRLGPEEPLDAVLRRIALVPLVTQLQKQRELDRTTRLHSLFNAAPRATQRNVLELLGGRDD